MIQKSRFSFEILVCGDGTISPINNKYTAINALRDLKVELTKINFLSYIILRREIFDFACSEKIC